MPFIILTLLINFDLILNFATLNHSNLFNEKIFDVISYSKDSNILFSPTLWISASGQFVADFFERFPASFCSLPLFTVPKYNLYTLIIDIQLRSILVSMLAGFLINRLSQIDDFYESYSLLEPLPKGSFLDKIARFFGSQILRYDLQFSDKLRRKHLNQTSYFSNLVSNIKHILTNDWINSITWNKKAEVLMVDIRTLDDHMYSGVFTNFVCGKSNELEAVSMFNVLCYYPEKAKSKEEDKNDPAPADKVATAKGAAGLDANKHKQQNDFHPSKRKWRLIKNDGEMFIPSTQISTVNFWYLRKGVKLKEISYHNEDYIFEKIKWSVKLLYANIDIIDSFQIIFYYLDKEEKDLFINKFNKWFSETGFEAAGKIIISFKKVSIKDS